MNAGGRRSSPLVMDLEASAMIMGDNQIKAARALRRIEKYGIVPRHGSSFVSKFCAGEQKVNIMDVDPVHHSSGNSWTMKSEPPSVTGSSYEKLLAFIENGFQNPTRTVQEFRASPKCSGSACSVDCADLLLHFSNKEPWRKDGAFFQWCRQWYPPRYEEPLNAFFTLPLVASSLSSAGWSQRDIEEGFVTEFGGKGKLSGNVPSCMWKSKRSVCIEKIFDDHSMCADFVFLPPLPPLVVEIKVAMPENKPKAVLELFQNDLRKCEEWLAPDTAPFVQKSFGIERFDHALALLIDLGCKGLDDFWNTTIHAEHYSRRGIITKRITAGAQKNHQIQSVPETVTRKSPPEDRLEFALEMAKKCEATAVPQAVEIHLSSFDEAKNFAETLKSFIRNYNQEAKIPIKNASPWVWRKESSGRPMTNNGREYGVEIRFSFQKAGNGLT
jgi:hypothetical protein